MRSNASFAGSRHAIRIGFFLNLILCLTLLTAGRAQAQTFTVLHTFTGAPDGSDPDAGVIVDAAGNIYGTTYHGGVSFGGTVFKLSSGGKETILYNFRGMYGQGPESVLFRDAQGTLYGTAGGGTHGWGVIFEVAGKGKEKVLLSLTKNDGGGPNAVIRDAQGNSYASTSDGCDNGCGAVFELNAAGKQRVLYSFTGEADGGNPMGSLVRDDAGNLYGVTYEGGDLSCLSPYGCGVVFKLDTAGNETVLYSFTGGSDGEGPVGITREKDGTFYGATVYGGGLGCGGLGCGTVFKLDTSGKEAVLYSFTGTGGDGEAPSASVVLDPAGNIYGTTLFGGNDGSGVVFKLDTSGRETILHSFTGGEDGAWPEGVVLDRAANLYGTTSFGGKPKCGQGDGCGTVFKISP